MGLLCRKSVISPQGSVGGRHGQGDARVLLQVDRDESKFGCLPKMAIASEGMMCAVMAASFCERVNSRANLVVTEGSSLLSQEEIDKLVVLRMNKDFMKFMRKNYPEIINSAHAKFGSVVSPEDSREDEAVPDDQPNSVDVG